MSALDKTQAAEFLAALDPLASQFTFQTFDDNSARKAPELASIFHGSLDQCWPHIERLNAAGAGVFVTVQETDGRGRKVENIKRIRALFHEDDGAGFVGDMPAPPQIEVESSPGKRHRYWLVDGMTPEQYRDTMQALVERHGSDPRAKDAARVLRLPGTLHNKGTPHLVRLVSTKYAALGPMPASEAARAFPPIARPVAPAKEYSDFNRAHVMRALSHVPASDRETWLQVGMALHHATAGSADGFALWDFWSQSAPEKYQPETQAATWDAFKRDRAGPAVTLGSLFHAAAQHGYVAPALDPVAGFESATPQPTAPAVPLLRFPRDASVEDIRASLDRDIIGGIMPYGEEAVLYGDPAAGKTFLAIDLAWHVALGAKSWHGRTVNRHPVLYVALEGHTGFDMRMLAARNIHGDPGTWFARLNVPITLVRDDNGVAGMRTIMAAAAEMEKACGQPVGLIVIDTLSRALAGAGENDQADMSYFVQERMAKLRMLLGATVLVVHHTNKSGSMRGSSVITGAANTILRCERDKQNTSVRAVIAEKVKDGVEGPLFHYVLDVQTLGARSDMTPITSCTVAETASNGEAEQWARKLLPHLMDGMQTLNFYAAKLASDDGMHRGDDRTKLARSLAKAFRGKNEICVDGMTLVYQSRGDSGGMIGRVTNNH